MRPIVASALVVCMLVVAWSGCVQPATDSPTTDDASSPSASPSPTRTSVSSPDRSAPATSATAGPGGNLTRLDATAGPRGALTAFAWSVPEGSLAPYWPDAPVDWTTVFVEVMPLQPEPPVEAWSILFFVQREGTARLVQGALAPTLHGTSSLAVLETPIEEPAYVGSTYLALGVDYLQEGDELRIVVAADSEQARDFPVGLRVLSEAPEEQPSPDTDTFLERAGGAPLSPVPITGQGAGLQIPVYLEANALVVFGLRVWSDDVQIENHAPVHAPPMASLRQGSLSMASDSQEGWTFGTGLYWPSDGGGQWSGDVDARGYQVGGNSLVYWSDVVPYAGSVSFILFGLPSFLVEAGGAGAMNARMDLEVASVNDGVEILALVGVDLQTSLTTLLGWNDPSDGYVGTGLLGNVPPALFISRSPQAFTIHSMGGAGLTILGVDEFEAQA